MARQTREQREIEHEPIPLLLKPTVSTSQVEAFFFIRVFRVFRGQNFLERLKMLLSNKNYPIWEVLDFASRHGFDGVEVCDTDSTLRDGGTSKHLACGDGRIDCAKSLQMLRDGGFRGWIMVDEWEVPDPYDACLKCKRAIDAVGRG